MPGIFPASGDILQVRIGSYTPNQEGLNILHYKVGILTTGGATLQEIATTLDGLMSIPYPAWLAIGSRYAGVGVTNITPPRTVEYTSVVNDSPGAGIGMVPTQVSGLVQIKTFLGGASNRGRIFPPFPGADGVAATGGMNAMGLARLGAIAAAIPVTDTIVGMTGSTQIVLVVLHSTTTYPGGVATPTPTNAVSLKAIPAYATQRRRGQFGRLNAAPFS